MYPIEGIHMKISDEHFFYLIAFLSNLEFSKNKELLDLSIKSGGFEFIDENDENAMKDIASKQDELSFIVSQESQLYPKFQNLYSLMGKNKNLALFWGNVSFQNKIMNEDNTYFLFSKELNISKGVGEQFRVSSKTVFPQLNGIPLRNYPVHPKKLRDFKSLLERTSISPFDNRSYAVLLDCFRDLFSPNESSQERLKGLNLDDKKGFFLAPSNSFNLFLNLVF